MKGLFSPLLPTENLGGIPHGEMSWCGYHLAFLTESLTAHMDQS